MKYPVVSKEEVGMEELLEEQKIMEE